MTWYGDEDLQSRIERLPDRLRRVAVRFLENARSVESACECSHHSCECYQWEWAANELAHIYRLGKQNRDVVASVIKPLYPVIRIEPHSQETTDRIHAIHDAIATILEESLQL